MDLFPTGILRSLVRGAYEDKFIQNKKKLRKKMKKLKRMQENVEKIIQRQERENPGTECKIFVRSWLEEVRRKEEEVNVILQSVVETSSWVENVNSLIARIEHLEENWKKCDHNELVEKIGRKQFTYKELKTITDGFKTEIGRGGYGVVYLGALPNGVNVAVKKLITSKSDPKFRKRVDRFREEANILMTTTHKNLVTLVGCCVDDDPEHMALVYEYMEGGDLGKSLRSSLAAEHLSWRHRLRIAWEVAQGLKYLHEDCRPCIVHRDLKPENILLAKGKEAKISDFGLSKMFPDDNKTHVTTVGAGTPRYIDPEYVRTMQLRTESDVYSFGVVLMDLITGSSSQIYKDKEIKEIIDKKIRKDYDVYSANEIRKIAHDCIYLDLKDRPCMSKVVKDIENLLPVVGRDSQLSEIHGYIKDSQVQIVAILGAGGVGKTTLLKSIKDELSKNRDLFLYIIWIELSSQNNILDIQQKIAECIKFSFKSKDETEKRATELRNVLLHKKSLILIDNVWNWNELDFEKIGIPFCVGKDLLKIVLTTRLERVCTDMRAQKIVKLDCLDKEESLQLFQNNINVDIKNHNIRQQVDIILKKCSGLPLAIVTVARTVANYTRVEEWDDAVECLRNSPAEMEGMGDVMKRLKLSYDKLENDEIRSCLLYFSLFREGYNIEIEKLIRNWIGEGFLDDISNKNSFKKSFARGIGFVNKLKSFCLVEKSGFSDNYVKVHDVIREMLCWICKNERKEVFLVYDEDHDNVISNDYNDWNLAKGMYLNERQLKCTLPEEGMPPNLTSLIVRANYSHRIAKLPPDDFFRLTTSLRVLDLSFIRLEELPKSICELGELRHLNLFCANIKMLPVELGKLKNLTYLNLQYTTFLISIPDVAISQLSMLQSLNLFYAGYRWGSAEIINETEHRPLTFEGLRELKKLEELGVDVFSNSHLKTILADSDYTKSLSKSIARISFCNIEFTAEDLGQPIKLISTKRFPHLKRLVVKQCPLPGNILEIEEDQPVDVEILNLWFMEISSVVIVRNGYITLSNLITLDIYNCQSLTELSWTAHMPSLRNLDVRECSGIEVLVKSGEEETQEECDSYFPKLRQLEISRLEKLQQIHGGSRSLLFPALERLEIKECPRLTKLSLLGHDDDSTKDKRVVIICEQSQWDLLQWEDDQVKPRRSARPY